MILSNILNRILVIDDKEEETRGLREVMEADDVTVDYADPFKLAEKQFVRNRQLIFMDLMLDGDINHLKSNISRIINILRNNIAPSFGLYGLVVWTSHEDEVEQLKTSLGKAYKADLDGTSLQSPVQKEGVPPAPIKPIVPPLFVVSLDKNKYNQEGYGNLLADLETALSQNPAAYFFTTWYESVVKGVNQTISDIYRLAPEYPQQKDEIKYILYRIGLNHIGISKWNDQGYGKTTEDAFKAFDELLCADLNSQDRGVSDLFQREIQNPWNDDNYKKMKISANINSKLFIDKNQLSEQHIVPGYVYEVLKSDSPLVIKDKPSSLDNNNLDFVNVAIELTPPCDFSNKKVGSRLIGGFAFELKGEMANKEINKLNNSLKADRYYKLWMVMIDSNIMVYCFDFRYLYTPIDNELLDKANYKLLFRAKPNLFADVLQKFSSHAARLGLSNIDLLE